MTYTGTNPVLHALTDDELADLAVNFPHQMTLSQGQYNNWLEQSYGLRHLFDHGADSWPFG